MKHVRLRLIPLLCCGLLALLLAACGGLDATTGDKTPSGSESPAAETAPPVEEQATTKRITDDLGREIEVPVAPKRIVAGEFAAELLALGVQPVGAGDNSFKIIYTQDQMQGVERIGDPPNPEILLELDPDLVIAPTVFQEIYPEQMEQIGKLAPVFYLSFDQDPIYGIFTKLAAAIGKDNEAAAWIQDYEVEAAAAREQVRAELGEQTVSIFRVEKGRLRIYLNRNFAGYMLRSGLQAPAPDKVAAEIEAQPFGSAVEISLEMLPDYAGDHLLLIVRDEGDDQDAFAEIEQLELWKNLPAVKNGRVHKLETDKYYGSDIATIRETMKETAALLSGVAPQ